MKTGRWDAMRIRIARPLLLNHILSPYGIAVLSTIVFLVAWVFPPQLYRDLMREPDLMFLDAETLLFFLLCVAGFWTGLLLVDFVFPSPPLLQIPPRAQCLHGFALLFPLLITTAMAAIVGVQLFNRAPNVLVLLLSQQGEALKMQQSLEGTIPGPLAWASIMQIGVLWWTYWMLSNSRPNPPRRFRNRRFISWTVFAVGLIVQVALAVLKVSRGDLMPIFGGFAVLYLLGKIRRKELGTAKLLRRLLFLFVVAMGLFFLFGALRGTSGLVEAFASFIGYTLASYNRLTAVLHGTMKYPYQGHGVYLSFFLVYNSSVNALLPLKNIFGWPEFMDLWNSEFQAPPLAGLRYDLIWSGAFGYLFADFGWAAPLILSLYGMLYGFVWRMAKFETALGLTLYPWFAFNALAWFTWNSLFDSRAPFFLGAGLLLMAYEKVLSAKPLLVPHVSRSRNEA